MLLVKAIPQRTLKRLQRRINGMDPDQELKSCAHRYYPSIAEFINHLLWTMHRDRCCQHGSTCQHMEVMKSMMSIHSLCSECRNYILCNIDINDLFLLYGVTPLNLRKVCAFKLTLFLSFYQQFILHPRMAKLIITSLSPKAFKYFCRFMEWMIHESIRVDSADPKGNGMFQRYLLHQGQMLLLSVKYWKRKHLMHYLRTHHIRMLELIMEFKRRYPDHDEDEDVDYLSDSYLPIMNQLPLKLFNEKVVLGSAMKGLVKMIGDPGWKADWDEHDEEMKMLKDTWNLAWRMNLRCAFRECGKSQKDTQDTEEMVTLKLCKGCKLTFYCSRYCQKRAWLRHREHCKRLSTTYKL